MKKKKGVRAYSLGGIILLVILVIILVSCGVLSFHKPSCNEKEESRKMNTAITSEMSLKVIINDEPTFYTLKYMSLRDYEIMANCDSKFDLYDKTLLDTVGYWFCPWHEFKSIRNEVVRYKVENTDNFAPYDDDMIFMNPLLFSPNKNGLVTIKTMPQYTLSLAIKINDEIKETLTFQSVYKDNVYHYWFNLSTWLDTNGYTHDFKSIKLPENLYFYNTHSSNRYEYNVYYLKGTLPSDIKGVVSLEYEGSGKDPFSSFLDFFKNIGDTFAKFGNAWAWIVANWWVIPLFIIALIVIVNVLIGLLKK